MKDVFALRLKELIQLEGIKQKDVIAKVGVVKSSFMLWKEGIHFPRYDYLIKLADCLHVSASYLVGEGVYRSVSFDVAEVLRQAPTVFVRRLSEYKEKNNVSYYSLAQSLGMDQTSITNWIKGSLPETESLIKLADVMGESIDYLLGIE